MPNPTISTIFAAEFKKDQAMNVRENKIETLLLIIGDETKTRRAIMAEIGLKGRRHFRVNYLDPAMEKGYVRMLYFETPNKPEQAYYLTKEGMTRLQEFKRDQAKRGQYTQKGPS